MHKYTPARPPANKRPHPSPSPDPQVVPDSLPPNPSPGTKRSRTNDTALQQGSHSAVLSPDQERGVQQVSDSGVSSVDGTWLCFCRNHTGNIAELSKALIQVSTSWDNPSATMDPPQMEDAIERIESAAELFLYVRCERDAFTLYALFLKWAVNHNGPFCQCARDLVHRARVGCALSAMARLDLEVANALLEQTKSLSPLKDPQAWASWLLYESIFIWKLYTSRELIDGDGNCLVRLRNRFHAFGVSFFYGNGAAWLKLGAMLCEELSPFIKDSDPAKGHLKDLLQGLRDSLRGSPGPFLDYSIRAFGSGAVKSCLQWMQDSPLSPPLLTGGFMREFLAFWARLRSELRDARAPVWAIEIKSRRLRQTEFLAAMVQGLSSIFEHMEDEARRTYSMTQRSLSDDEIIEEVKDVHIWFCLDLFQRQILDDSWETAACISAVREMVRVHLSIVLPIPA
jgi:hypothetical protein